MTESSYNIAVVGATGVVGEAIVEYLEERNFPVGTLHLLASESSAGKRVPFRDSQVRLGLLDGFDFSQVQIAFFAVPDEVAVVNMPRAVQAGCIIIDLGDRLSGVSDIPLVIPEINPEAIADYRQHNIIATPCSATIQLAMALKPLRDRAGLERVEVVAYEAVSGMGRAGVEELVTQTTSMFNMREIQASVFPQQITFNTLAQVGEPTENGYSREELRIMEETRRLMGDPELAVNATAAWVPVFFGHALAVHLVTQQAIGADEALSLLTAAPGIEVMDAGAPSPVTEAAKSDAVHIGRVREVPGQHRALNLWIVCDNVRKGAALNGVQIAEILVKDYM